MTPNAKGGKNRWKGTTKKERSARMSEIAKKRWGEHQKCHNIDHCKEGCCGVCPHCGKTNTAKRSV